MKTKVGTSIDLIADYEQIKIWADHWASISTLCDEFEIGFCVVRPPNCRPNDEGIAVAFLHPNFVSKKGTFEFAVTHLDVDDFSGYPHGGWTGRTFYYRLRPDQCGHFLDFVRQLPRFVTGETADDEDPQWFAQFGITSPPRKAIRNIERLIQASSTRTQEGKEKS